MELYFLGKGRVKMELLKKGARAKMIRPKTVRRVTRRGRSRFLSISNQLIVAVFNLMRFRYVTVLTLVNSP